MRGLDPRIHPLREGRWIAGSSPAMTAERSRPMSSNIKPKPSTKESPTEPFKRAVTGCLRAIARKSDLDVTFAAERPGLITGKVRLPEPARKLSPGEAA